MNHDLKPSLSNSFPQSYEHAKMELNLIFLPNHVRKIKRRTSSSYLLNDLTLVVARTKIFEIDDLLNVSLHNMEELRLNIVPQRRARVTSSRNSLRTFSLMVVTLLMCWRARNILLPNSGKTILINCQKITFRDSKQ
ncbi:hypothetical protein U1Q18_022970 [Sarracenia purpurea var. burkii]